MLNAERTLLDRDKPVEDALRIAVVSIGSFDMQYSDYHIMRDLIVELLEHGHTVDLVQKKLLDKTQYPVQFEKYLGTRLFVHSIPFEKKDKSNLRARYLADLSYYRKACRFLKTSRPDKIFLQSNNTAFYTVFYAKHILKRPILYSEQDIFPENAYFVGILSSHSVVYKVAHSLQKYAYKNASMLTTISDDMKTTMIDRYGISSDKIHVIYNWGHEEVQAHDESGNVFLKKYPKKPGEFRVMYAGNLGRMQNIELILEVAALMKEQSNVSFYIVGSGVREEQLKSLAIQRALTNVIFVGMQPPEDVADLYKAADVNLELHYMRAIYDKDAELMPQFAERLHYEYAKVWNNAIMDKCLREVKASQYFLTPSAFVRRSLRYTGVKDAQMLNCPYGVDISEFSCKVYPKCHNCAPLKFVYVGGVKELKGISYLLEAFMQIPREQAELTVIGDFKAEDCDIKRYLNRVYFTGMVLHSEIPHVLHASDVFVFPSLGEGLSLSSLEAAACGLPLIVSENSGVNDYMKEGQEGFIIPIQDVDAIVQKVKWFCEHRERIEPMGRAARKMALQFTWERYYEQAAQIVKEVASNEKNRKELYL